MTRSKAATSDHGMNTEWKKLRTLTPPGVRRTPDLAALISTKGQMTAKAMATTKRPGCRDDHSRKIGDEPARMRPSPRTERSNGNRRRYIQFAQPPGNHTSYLHHE